MATSNQQTSPAGQGVPGDSNDSNSNDLQPPGDLRLGNVIFDMNMVSSLVSFNFGHDTFGEFQ